MVSVFALYHEMRCIATIYSTNLSVFLARKLGATLLHKGGAVLCREQRKM